MPTDPSTVTVQRFSEITSSLKAGLSIADDALRARAIASLKQPIYDGFAYSVEQREVLWKLLEQELRGDGAASWQSAVLLTSHLRTPQAISKIIAFIRDLRHPPEIREALLLGLAAAVRSGEAFVSDIAKAREILETPAWLIGLQHSAVSELAAALREA